MPAGQLITCSCVQLISLKCRYNCATCLCMGFEWEVLQLQSANFRINCYRHANVSMRMQFPLQLECNIRFVQCHSYTRPRWLARATFMPYHNYARLTTTFSVWWSDVQPQPLKRVPPPCRTHYAFLTLFPNSQDSCPLLPKIKIRPIYIILKNSCVCRSSRTVSTQTQHITQNW